MRICVAKVASLEIRRPKRRSVEPRTSRRAESGLDFPEGGGTASDGGCRVALGEVGRALRLLGDAGLRVHKEVVLTTHRTMVHAGGIRHQSICGRDAARGFQSPRDRVHLEKIDLRKDGRPRAAVAGIGKGSKACATFV